MAQRLRRHPRTIRDWIAKGCGTGRGRVHLDPTRAGKAMLCLALNADVLAYDTPYLRKDMTPVPIEIPARLGR